MCRPEYTRAKSVNFIFRKMVLQNIPDQQKILGAYINRLHDYYHLSSRPGSCLPGPSQNRTSSFPTSGSSFGLWGFAFMFETDLSSP
jgi:hypothetical protein